jgi:hypothetical protein
MMGETGIETLEESQTVVNPQTRDEERTYTTPEEAQRALMEPVRDAEKAEELEEAGIHARKVHESMRFNPETGKSLDEVADQG